MKNDKFLIGILGGIGILILVTLGMYFLRAGNVAYGPEDTPEGVVHNYLLALEQMETSRAYGYLAESVQARASESDFEWFFTSNRGAGRNVTLELRDVRTSGDNVLINVVVQHGGTGPFDSGWRENAVARLVREEGTWKILEMPYPFFDYSWTQEFPR